MCIRDRYKIAGEQLPGVIDVSARAVSLSLIHILANIIVAFSKPEDAKSIKNILMKNGFEVVAVCTSGAQVLSQMEDLNGGIVVCGYRLTDMLYSELRECMSAENAMLMIASPNKWSADAPQDVDVYKRQSLHREN